MDWESLGVVGFDLGLFLQGQNKDGKPTYLTLDLSFKVKQG